MLFVEDDTTPDDARDAQLGSLASKLKEVPRDFPFVTKLFIVLVPILIAIGYLTYAQVRGGVTISTTPPTTPRLEQGLVGHWTFDGGDMISSTTVRDLSSSNATGTLVNGPTKSIGRFGQGLSFDGSNDYVLVTDVNALDITGAITLSTWLKTSDTDSCIISKSASVPDACFGSAATKVFELGILSGTLWFQIGNGTAATTLSGSASTILDNEWHFVTATWDGTTGPSSLKVYIDGSLMYEATSSVSVIQSGTTELLFSGKNGDYDYAGSMDETRIYNRALSVSEIRELYDIGTPTKLNSGISQPQGVGNLDSGLAGYWAMDEGSGTSATDSSTNGNVGTLTNSPTWTTGQIGRAVDFDGTDDYISATASNVTSPTRLSGAAWVKVDDFVYAEHYTIFSNRTVGNTGWTFGLATNETCNGVDCAQLEFVIQGVAAYITTASLVRENQWVHVAFTWNGAYVSFYVDGQLVQTMSTGAMTTGSTLLIGAFGPTGLVGYYMDGSIDEARVYDRALSPDEVSALYELTVPTEVDTGLKGYWSFNGPDMSGTTAYDRSGAGNHGTLTNNPTKVIGKLGQGLHFDMVDDYVNAGSAASLDDLIPLSISIWIKPNSIGEGGNLGKIIGKNASVSAGSWQFSLVSNTSCVGGDPTILTDSLFFTKVGAAGAARAIRCSANNVVTFDEWQHYVLTWDGSTGYNSTGIHIYKNGTEVAYTTIGTSAIDSVASDSTFDLIIGNRPTADRTFDGEIDEVRIYNRIISAGEITNLYHAGRGVTVNAATYTTPVPFSCGVSTVQDADGNTYSTLSIGSQCWMQQNLRIGTRIDRSTLQSDNDIIEKYCYDDTDSNCITDNPNYPDGGLYQWDEAMQYTTVEGGQGICPSGWHIPTHDEFTTLERTICTAGSCITDFPYDTTTIGSRGTDEGTKLKSDGTSGFEANLAGYSDVEESFFSRTSIGILWSSSERDVSAWNRYVSLGSGQVVRSADDKTGGVSVRCLKN